MNVNHKLLADVIKKNTVVLRDKTVEMDVEAIDKMALVEALISHFQKTDALFDAVRFAKACEL